MLPGVTASFDRVAAALADRYRLIRELGSGGMATVYLAEDMRHRRQVAVKVLRPELAATLGADRFTREIETVAQFQHPHILPLLDSGQADGFFYYVMPSVEGESLRDRLARHGELPIHDAVKILVEVVDALAYAHAHGVVHRDIKPDNVLLSGRHALATPSGGTTPTATRPMAAVIGTPLRRYVAAAVVLAAVVVGVVLLARPRPPAVALGRRVQVTLDPGLEIDPALSPDGKLIAYTAGSPGRMRLYVRQLEGGTPVPVVRGVGGFQRLPHWAPDGARLLFLSDRGIEIAA